MLKDVATPVANILEGDEAWVALALLHREHPERTSFTAREILRRVGSASATPKVRAGIAPHIRQLNVANVSSFTGTYRMFYRMPDGTYRLYRTGDACHPHRKGKTIPSRAQLPETYHHLLDWYEREYRGSPSPSEVDPVLAIAGAGKAIWQEEDGDAFVKRLRDEFTT